MSEVQEISMEEMFTPQELAKMWKYHPTTIQRLFTDEPGVMKISEPRSRRRKYVTMRIPASVAHRVYQKRSR